MEDCILAEIQKLTVQTVTCVLFSTLWTTLAVTSNKQASKQTNKQTSKQTSKQTNKQTNKQNISEKMVTEIQGWKPAVGRMVGMGDIMCDQIY